MMAPWILGVIFSFVCAIVFIAESERTTREKNKIEAALRREEMERGYTPGTYSSDFAIKKDEPEEVLERSRGKLENGLLAIKKRIGTMSSR
ncbi:MAG: hypothetical protein ACI4S4_03760 [Candidatus Ornithospirochaeta sp.]